MNALPLLLRHGRGNDDDKPVHVFAPAAILHRLRQFSRLSWAVKVDMGDPLPEAYEPPCTSDEYPVPGTVIDDPPARVWHPVSANDEPAEIVVGKKHNTPLMVDTLQLFHGKCTSVGYVLASPAKTLRKVRPDLVGSNQQETGANVVAAKARGEDIHVLNTIPESPILAFVLDTTVQALECDTADKILACPVVIIECTYLEDSKQGEAKRRGHVWWGGLLKYVASSMERRKTCGVHQTWVLVHFSLRYTDQQIMDFFTDETQSRLRLKRHRQRKSMDGNTINRDDEDKSTDPPDLVVWLDSGPMEMWIEEMY